MGTVIAHLGMTSFRIDFVTHAGMAELADAADSKSADRKVVGVRPPLPAPQDSKRLRRKMAPPSERPFSCWCMFWCMLDQANRRLRADPEEMRSTTPMFDSAKK